MIHVRGARRDRRLSPAALSGVVRAEPAPATRTARAVERLPGGEAPTGSHL